VRSIPFEMIVLANVLGFSGILYVHPSRNISNTSTIAMKGTKSVFKVIRFMVPSRVVFNSYFNDVLIYNNLPLWFKMFLEVQVVFYRLLICYQRKKRWGGF
jgi:hypothetical protein